MVKKIKNSSNVKIALLFVLLLLAFSDVALAGKLTCPVYLGEKDNAIFNAGLIGSQKDYFSSWEGDDIVPDREVEKGSTTMQYFYPERHKNYKRLFLLCVYADNGIIVREITSKYKECMGTYGRSADSMSFYCQ